MAELESYLNEILNSSLDNIKELVMQLEAHSSKCKSCGGSTNNGTCKYCGTIDIDVQEILRKIIVQLNRFKDQIANLNIKSIPFNEFCNLLVAISGWSKDIDSFLQDYGYYEVYNNKIAEFLKQLTATDSLFKVDNDVLGMIRNELLLGKYSMNFDNSSSEDVFLIFYFFLKNPQFNEVIGYEAFRQLVKSYTVAFIKSQTDASYNAKCFIVDKISGNSDNDIIVGSCFISTVELLESNVKELYENKSYHILTTIFHECAHVVQNYLGGMIDGLYQDHILRSELKGYYNANYHKLAIEVHARIVGYRYTYMLLSGIGLAGAIPNSAEESYTSDLDLLKNFDRTIFNEDGNPVKVDIKEFFDDWIASRPDLLRRYPDLSIIYRITDGKVVRKSLEELQEEAELVKANISMPETQRKRLLTIYDGFSKKTGFQM